MVNTQFWALGLGVFLSGLVFLRGEVNAALRPTGDFVEAKAIEQQRQTGEYLDAAGDMTETRGRRRFQREAPAQGDKPLQMNNTENNIFDTGRITNYKVLRDDQVVEIRNPRSGKLVLTIIKASALPEEELNRYDYEYQLMELDNLSIQVEKNDQTPKKIRVGWDGRISYPLIGELYVKGKTAAQVEAMIAEKFSDFIHTPNVRVEITEKSPLATNLVIQPDGSSGFRQYQGHEKILDILGASYKPSVESIYDKVCVLRKNADGSYRCIVVDMEYMFTKFDFRQNIPIRAGDIIQVKRMPPLFGYRFKYWWHQVFSWLSEISTVEGDIKQVVEWKIQKN